MDRRTAQYKFSLEGKIQEQLGCDTKEEFKQTLKDVCRAGANAGFSGFTYSSECLEFYKENRTEILEDLKELAESIGEGGLLHMVLGFNCLKDYNLNEDILGEIIYGKNYEHEDASLVIDALCWAVLENVAFRYDC